MLRSTHKVTEVGDLLSRVINDTQSDGGNPQMFCCMGPQSEIDGWVRLTQTTQQTITAWTANQVAFFPIMILQPFTVSNGWWLNAGTVNGTVHIGVYDIEYNRLCAGSATMSGASAFQTTTITTTTLAPGNYFIAFGSTSSTAIFTRASGNAAIMLGHQIKAQNSAISGGAMANPASPSRTNNPIMPFCGIYGTTF